MKRGTRKNGKAIAGKPHPDFPLFKHATGRWAKKVKGKFRYFGKVADDPQGQAALARWLEEKDDLLAGRVPRPKSDSVTIKMLLNQFRAAKKLEAESGEIAPRTFSAYHSTMDRIRDVFGLSRPIDDLTAADFAILKAEISKGRELSSMKLEMQKTRTVFNYAYDSGLIDRPVRFGPSFKLPKEKALRRIRGQAESMMFEAEEVKTLLAAASPVFRAMIFLACNCGFGNNDLATLPRSAVDLEGGWVTHPRPKTGAPRRAKLWPKAIEALRVAYAERPKPAKPADDRLVFLGKHGQQFARFGDKAWSDAVKNGFDRLLRDTGLRKRKRGFYGFRRGFETIASETADQVAVDYIMGHLRGDMASVYRQRITDDRLEKVSDHVHAWLFGETAEKRKMPGRTRAHDLKVIG